MFCRFATAAPRVASSSAPVWDPSTADHTSLWLVADDAVNGAESGGTYPSLTAAARNVSGTCDASSGSSSTAKVFTQHSGHGNTVKRTAAPAIDGHYALRFDAYGALSCGLSRLGLFGPFVSSGAGGGDDVNSVDYSYAMVIKPVASNSDGVSNDIGGVVQNASIMGSADAGKSGMLSLTLARDGSPSLARIEAVHYNAYVGMAHGDLDLGAFGAWHLLEVSYVTATETMLIRLDGVTTTLSVGKVRSYLADPMGTLILGNWSAGLHCQFELAECIFRNRAVSEMQMIEHETYFANRYPSLGL